LLKGEVRSVSNLNDKVIERMYLLMKKHYASFKKEKFLLDLSEKDGVIILTDEDNEIEGFSTYLFIDTEYENDKIAALFSGDTIIDNKYWGTPALFNIFGKLLHTLMKDNKGKKCYWFLITKGFRTYLLLPLYFNNFFPRYDKETPDYEKGLIDHLASLKYREYDRELGLIKAPSDFLKGDFAEIPEKRKDNKHVNFFLLRNPGFSKGHELACVCEINNESFRRRTKNMVRP